MGQFLHPSEKISLVLFCSHLKSSIFSVIVQSFPALVSWCYLLYTAKTVFNPLIPWGIEDRTFFQELKEQVLLPALSLPMEI